MAERCGQELCDNWTGEGCWCAVAGIDATWTCPGCDTEYDSKPLFDMNGVCGDCYEEGIGQ